jgi:ABC-2 type transport system ATP-binding protein
LDEPLAMLDPLARQDFMATVLTAMTDDGVSVLLSSHALAELERVADYLVLLAGGQLQVAGEVDDLLTCHRLLTGPAAEADRFAGRLRVIQTRRAGAQAHLLVRTSGQLDPAPPGWEAHPVTLEELVLAYLRSPDTQTRPGLSLARPARRNQGEPTEVTR